MPHGASEGGRVRGKLVLFVGWCGRVAALAIATAVLAVANPSSEGRAAAFHAQQHSGSAPRNRTTAHSSSIVTAERGMVSTLALADIDGASKRPGAVKQ